MGVRSFDLTLMDSQRLSKIIDRFAFLNIFCGALTVRVRSKDLTTIKLIYTLTDN